MENFKYISLFSGIGGFEHSKITPVTYCEIDRACREALMIRNPNAVIQEDVKKFVVTEDVDAVVGGWPCQDISSAGKQAGIKGERSGLFFKMLEIASDSKAHTIIGENVPNLLTINKGEDFREVIKAVQNSGFPYVAWRILNARSFGIPQDRKRLFIVASKHEDASMAIHSQIPKIHWSDSGPKAYGFYWTGGKRSICFSPGFAPTLKVGATDNKGRAPIAVFINNSVRKLSPKEFIRLQGFDNFPFDKFAASTILRMAGNAVVLPVGRFVVDCVAERRPVEITKSISDNVPISGLVQNNRIWSVKVEETNLAQNLGNFLDTDYFDQSISLSPQAAAGLIVRSVQSGTVMPSELFDTLYQLSVRRTKKIKAARSNSFELLDLMTSQLIEYRNQLPDISRFEVTNA